MTNLVINVPEWESNDLVVNPVDSSDKDGRLSVRAGIDTYEEALKDLMGSERGDADAINEQGLTEYFVGGAYTRSLLIPKDTTIVSKLWNKERLWIIATGEVSITTEAGVQRVKAPYVMQPIFGSKVALYTHEDTLWFAITGAEATNSEDIEDEVIVNDYKDLPYPWESIENRGEE